MSDLTDRLIIKIVLSIENDNQDKVQDYFREYNIKTNYGRNGIGEEEHRDICLKYINYQVKKTEEKKDAS